MQGASTAAGGIPEPQVGQQDPTFVENDDLVNTFVVNLFIKRRDYGVKKYGHELTVDNGRDMDWDAIEEQADKLVYMIGSWMRKKKHKVAALDILERAAQLTCSDCFDVEELIREAIAEVGVI